MTGLLTRQGPGTAATAGFPKLHAVWCPNGPDVPLKRNRDSIQCCSGAGPAGGAAAPQQVAGRHQAAAALADTSRWSHSLQHTAAAAPDAGDTLSASVPRNAGSATASVLVAATIVDALHVLQTVNRAGAAAEMLAHL